jgi:hypothetical protein
MNKKFFSAKLAANYVSQRRKEQLQLNTFAPLRDKKLTQLSD